VGATRKLAEYLVGIDWDELPPQVQRRAKLAVLDSLGVSLGGYAVPEYSEKFIDLAKAVGGGVGEATIIGDGTKVSAPFASFANTALATALDYCDHAGTKTGIAFCWFGALAVPAALGAVEVSGGDGKEFLSAVVAGYECSGRILRSIDMTAERERELKGETISVFSAAAAAARGHRFDADRMLSTLGMAGIEVPVSSGYKWLMDAGLRPRKDYKQGWAWMSLAGAFAATAASHGLRALQENNILDGDRGLWRMLGMDVTYPEELLRDLGVDYVLPHVETKRYPGCSITHTGLIGAMEIVRANGLSRDDIARIEVTTNKRSGMEEDDQAPATAQDMQFSVPYQVGAALSGYPRGPQWYTLARERALGVASRTFLLFDEECGEFWEKNRRQMSKIKLITRDGITYTTRVEDEKRLNTTDEIEAKFMETAVQVIGEQAARNLKQTVMTLDEAPDLTTLLEQLHVASPAPAATAR